MAPAEQPAARFVDEAETRAEITRVFDHCSACRRCLDLCDVFPSLFARLDAAPGAGAGDLTPADQDTLTDACHQCDRCRLGCPYAPGQHAAAIDVPGLVVRARAMRRATGQMPGRERIAVRLTTGGRWARTVASAVGLAPPVVRERFSAWFRGRTAPPAVNPSLSSPERRVVVYPTCMVEYHAPEIGRSLVRVLEHHEVSCSVSEAGCCGAPLLESGDLRRFVATARNNVAILAGELRGGGHVVMAQPSCARMVIQQYPAQLAGTPEAADAAFVAEHTREATGHLLTMNDEGLLSGRFPGEVPGSMTYHASCHVRSLGLDGAGAELLALTGAEVRTVQACAGANDPWSRHAGEHRAPCAGDLANRLGGGEAHGRDDVVVGHCHLANAAVVGQGGPLPQHPVQVLARAYGLDPS